MSQSPMRIDEYIESLSDEERQEVALAEVAIDLARLLYHARERRQITQSEAARLAEMRQQAISRLEQPGANIQVATLQRYLSALGYTLELTILEQTTDDIVDQVRLIQA
jgi:transcriptional regulator with XRE-family HTH domain